ncbi:hypothetical protein FRC06_006864 [Ceratobasidium sp. 370]|nr:hypothetical protein FRC06_006864 [Ceratobasidium sp. 370]
MNRPGQAPRVPPNLNPTAQQQQLASQFRTGVYAPYGMPQTQQQRAPAQAAYPPPARTAYALPARNSFPFGAVQQQQQANAAQQSHLHALMQQPNGSSATPAPNGANTPDTSTSLDPNEFPALGTSAPQPPFSYAAAGASGGGAGAGYAPPGGNYSQGGNYATAGAGTYAGAGNYASAGAGGNYAAAGAGAGAGSAAGGGFGGASANGQGQGQGQGQQQASQRELTQDDFPALGQGDGGFANSVDQHRQNLLGQIGVSHAMRNMPGYQSELDKRQQQTYGTMKLNPPNHATAAAWAAQAPPQQPSQQPQTQPPSQPQPSQTTNVAPAPAGTPGPFGLNGQGGSQTGQIQGQGQAQAQTQGASPAPTTASIGTNPSVPGQPNQPTPSQSQSQPTSQNQSQGPATPGAIGAVPMTPAQQVLISAADRWGLLGLLQIIKGADPDVSLLNVGADLSGMGLDMGMQGHLFPSFITPWSDASAALSIEPDYHLPACYNVQPPPPAQAKANAFSDETLFFMFYSAPRDVLQEMASQELYNRNWRFHKERRVWLTKETGTSPSQKTSTHESGVYTFFDPENWERVKMHARIQYDQLEEKHTVPLQAQGQGQAGQGQGQQSVQRAGYVGQ